MLQLVSQINGVDHLKTTCERLSNALMSIKSLFEAALRYDSIILGEHLSFK
jgi:hypothetical protein